MHVLASFTASHVPSVSPQEPCEESLEHVTIGAGLLCTQHPLPVTSEMLLISGSFASSLHRPLKASLWLVTYQPLSFLSVDCMVDGAFNFGSRDSGTFTFTVPSSVQMYCITKSMIFSSHLSSVPNMGGFGIPMLLNLDRITSTVFTDDRGKHCGCCSSRGHLSMEVVEVSRHVDVGLRYMRVST